MIINHFQDLFFIKATKRNKASRTELQYAISEMQFNNFAKVAEEFGVSLSSIKQLSFT